MVQLIDFAVLDIKELNKSFLVDFNEKDEKGNNISREITHEIILIMEYSKYGNSKSFVDGINM